MPRRVLITGGSSGIGRAIALELAKGGETIYITGRNEKRLQVVSKEIDKNGGQAYFGVADVTNRDEVDSIVSEAINKLGGIDILVANAGVGRFKNLEEFTDEDYDIQFDTNVKGVFYFLRPVLKLMKSQDHGQIVVTSSNLGLMTGARCGIYAATKHALQAMVGALRQELRGTKVKAATINPGSVDTPWYDGKDVDRDKMLTAMDVAKSTMLILNQSETSDIDHLLLLPGRG